MIGVPHDTLGEAVGAVIVRKAGAGTAQSELRAQPPSAADRSDQEASTVSVPVMPACL